MKRLFVPLIILMFAASTSPAETSAPKDLKDLYFGEALYHAYQGEWFDAVSRLDTELALHYGVDEPERDTLHYHVNQAEFDVGDFELYYRMHRKAGRAIKAVIEGNVPEPVRNEAIFRLARIYFQKGQPKEAQEAVDRIKGAVPEKIRNDLAFLKAEILMANGRFAESARIFTDIQDAPGFLGFSTYNLGIALIRDGKEIDGRSSLVRAGQIKSDDNVTLAIKDKSNLVLGEKLLSEKKFAAAKYVLDRVRLTGPFSNRALLSSGWADASLDYYQDALVPWTILSGRAATDPSVEEAMLAVPYAYIKLGIYSKAALLYSQALEAFGREIEKLSASITSIQEGKFLKALLREELKQDPDWVVKLRELPEAPETFYLLDLLASHDFQESLKNYLDLEELRVKLSAWSGDLIAFKDITQKRRAYYQPLLPEIDREFRRLDTLMRLRLSQRDSIEKRLHAMLTAPRPEQLETADERVTIERLNQLERKLAAADPDASGDSKARIKRLRGVLYWNMYTEYDRRLTEAFRHLHDLSSEIDRMRREYSSFIRTRQGVTQSYEGYDDVIRTLSERTAAARKKVGELMSRQGEILETLAVTELTRRRDRLEKFQVDARFAMADSYDRARKAQDKKRAEQ
jgi:tetratricopeptide (TPR) repeat protein